MARTAVVVAVVCVGALVLGGADAQAAQEKAADDVVGKLTDSRLSVLVSQLQLQVAARRRQIDATKFEIYVAKAGMKAEKERESVLREVVEADAKSGDTLADKVLDEKWRRELIRKKVKEGDETLKGVQSEIEKFKGEADNPRLSLWVKRNFERVGGYVSGEDAEEDDDALQEDPIMNVGEVAGAVVDTVGDTAVQLETAVASRGVPQVVAFWVCFLCLALPVFMLRIAVAKLTKALDFKQTLLVGYVFTGALFALAFLAVLVFGVDPIAGLGVYCRRRPLMGAVVSGLVVVALLAVGRSFVEGAIVEKGQRERRVYGAQALVVWLCVFHFLRSTVRTMRHYGMSGLSFSKSNGSSYFCYALMSSALAYTLLMKEGEETSVPAVVLEFKRVLRLDSESLFNGNGPLLPTFPPDDEDDDKMS